MEKVIEKFKFFHRLTIIISFLSIILPIVFWKQIPDQIPQHYGASGRADAWTDKGFLILMFIFALMMLGMMSIAEYFVKSSGLSANTPKSEKGSLLHVYPMIVLMNLALQMMIAYIIFCCATARNLGRWFVLVVLILTFAPLVYFLPKSIKAGMTPKEQTAHLKQKELEVQGEVFRSKVDWWLGVILIGCVTFPVYLLVKGYLESGDISWTLLVTEIFILALLIPMFNMKYILYPDHLLIICIGKERIPYRNITSMKETHNPLSSAALSLDRLQIDYKMAGGSNNMILISPKRKKEFIDKINRKRELYME